MKVLIAEDDAFFRRLLQQILAPLHEVVTAEDGKQAWEALQRADAPRLAILDWVMPGMSGPQLCRKIRESPTLQAMYLILLTARNSVADVVAGLAAGADDYVTKPCDPAVLLARVRVGQRLIEMQRALAEKSAALEEALARAGASQGSRGPLEEMGMVRGR